MRSLAAPILALLVLALAAPASAYYMWGTVYISGPTSVEATITAKIVDGQAVSVNVNSTYKFNVTPPRGWDLPGVIEAVIVKVSSTASGAKLVALDANGTQIATADIVPLSSGFSMTFPGNTASVEIQNLATSVWQGTITILVQSTVKFNFTFPDQITVQDGQGQGTVYAKQISGPAGKIYISEYDNRFDIAFQDPSPEYSGDNMVETTGAGWSENIPLVVTAGNVSPDSYSVSFKVYFEAKNGVKAELAEYSMVITLNSQGQGQATVQPIDDEGSGKWMYAGIGVVVGLIFAMLFIGNNRGRRGMAPAWLILLIALAALAFAAGLMDVSFNFNVDPVWLGVGVIALLVLFAMSRQGLIKIRR